MPNAQAARAFGALIRYEQARERARVVDDAHALGFRLTARFRERAGLWHIGSADPGLCALELGHWPDWVDSGVAPALARRGRVCPACAEALRDRLAAAAARPVRSA